MRDFRKKPQSLGEEIGNAITHGIGFILSIVGTILLLINSHTFLEYFSAALFGFGMLFLYINSTLYHAFKRDTTVKRVYKRLDHISIYTLIAATFSPILLLVIGGKVGWIIFIIQWTLTILGIVTKAIWPNRFQIVHLILFLLIGWSGVFFMPQIHQFSSMLVTMILLGGASYTLGVLFYAVIIFKYHHFIWHFFVLGGSILHFLGIYICIFLH